MIWKDGVLRIWTLGEMGLFACECAPSARSLENAVSFWRKAGCKTVLGPVSPGAAEVQSGLCVWRADEKPELLAPKQAADESVFLRAGFDVAGESLAFRLNIPDLPYRPGAKVTCGVSPEACARVMKTDPYQTQLALENMSRMMDRTFCFTAFRDGPAGILICLRKRKQLRLLTLWSREDCRNGVVCMPMLYALSQTAQKMRMETIDAAQIPTDNPFSLRLARRLGGREIGRYRQYKLNL